MTMNVEKSLDSQSKLMTAEEMYQYGDSLGRGELVRGKFIEEPPPNYRHGLIENNVAYFLNKFVRENSIGYVLVGESGVFTEHMPDTVRGADVVVLTHAQLEAAKNSTYLTQGPLLIVEVVSKNDRKRKVQRKIEEYFAIGTSMVWIVNWETQQTTLYTDPSTSTRYQRHEFLKDLSVPEFEGMVIELDKIFQGI